MPLASVTSMNALIYLFFYDVINGYVLSGHLDNVSTSNFFMSLEYFFYLLSLSSLHDFHTALVTLLCSDYLICL